MTESGPHDQAEEPMVDLLIKQVTEGLSPAEQRELDVLDSAASSAHLRAFERAAAAIALAGSTDGQPLPADLAKRLARQADEHFALVGTPAAGRPALGTPGAADPAAARAAALRANAAARRGTYGWIAAAACLVLAVVAWNRALPPAPVAEVVAPPSTAAEERAALLAKSDSLKITFGVTEDPAAAGVSGDVVWDPATQRGFLRFVGLAPNDPAMRQYQLWIFDGGRDKRYPVDGGVFDIPPNAAEVVVPIHAALPVLSAKAFAVTIEKPGGVVVSGREHVVVLGAAG
jgi:hypothetical protein